MASQTVHFASLDEYFAAIGKVASPQDVETLKLIMSIPAPKPATDVLTTVRGTVEDDQTSSGPTKIPAYFAALQSWLDPMKAEMERNAADALTPTNHDQDAMAAVRDLCR